MQREALPEAENQQEFEEEGPVQAKADSPGRAAVSPQVGSGINALRGGGQPFSVSNRAFFEPRFGADFSGVRVHTGTRAAEVSKSISAKAFTLGRDVFFGAGQYAPESSEGKKLMAHELTHVIQQRRASRIQRKVMYGSGIGLNSYLTKKGLKFVKTPTTYVGVKGHSPNLEKQIIIDLLSSDRLFTVAGNTAKQKVNNFNEHVQARQRVVSYTGQKKYAFGAGSKMRVNPKYWKCSGGSGGSCNVKKGQNKMAALHDLIRSKKFKLKILGVEFEMRNRIACHMATQATMYAGTKTEPFIKDNNVKPNDWIPGDWGYVDNTISDHPILKLMFKPGEEGENIIYIGNKEYWGHYSSKITKKSLKLWEAHVRDFGGGRGKPKVVNWRKRPSNGLK